MTREEILGAAKKCVCGGRDNEYGAPERSFGGIAAMWEAYLRGRYEVDLNIVSEDVAAMMVLFKMARVSTGAGKTDNWVDAAGYAACGGAIGGIYIEPTTQTHGSTS